ncbi:protein IQ-DOMAIN 32 isoform X1 [Typha latifolia]|uniref:protein IQ-DOMAIN 32 isoform X1 n=1 Tax=Typha latifolia TaxID=4733 RepID=UPI003C2BF19C
MGREKSSCFKILLCAGAGGGGGTDSAAAADDIDLEETKAISDKHRWSFRKRSTRHRVLSNSVISEPLPVSCNKENLDLTTDNVCSPKYCSAPEKVHEQEKPNETILLPTTEVNQEEANLVASSAPLDQNDIERASVFIQAGIRGYLARRKQQKLESVVKIQAAVRGHLVRRQAVETLHCLHAIIKMQALVRARQAHQSAIKKSAALENNIFQAKGNSCEEPNKICSTEILFLNGFANQIMESMPRTKTMHIKCDPSKSDSVWKWFERWTTVTLPHQGYVTRGKVTEFADNKAVDAVPCRDATLPSDSDLVSCGSVVQTDNEVMPPTLGTDVLDYHSPLYIPDDCSSFSMKGDQERKFLKNEAAATVKENHLKTEKAADKTSASVASQQILDTCSDKSDTYTSSVAPCEPHENDGRKFVLKKPCNPAFAAAQLKFEELSSSSTADRPVNFAYQDSTSKSRLYSLHSQVESSTKSNNCMSLSESSVGDGPRVHIAASECGTEISISSTLDSPDRSENEGGEIVLEIGALEKQNFTVSCNADNDTNFVNMHAEGKSPCVLEGQLRKLEEGDGFTNMITANDLVDVEQQPTESTTLDVQHQLEKSVDQQDRSSPEGTPRSHMTVSDLHGTPSSQISVNAKMKKRDKNVPNQRQRSHPASKRSLSSPNTDSGGRSSMENLPKDSKNTKRHNSSGMTKTDHVDHEPRISNSNPLPSYMQATESARAKVQASISPKLSPDVQDNQTRKRHSLPIGDGKQGSSPRMQRSASQAKQSLKVNGTHSPHNSAERRWQR